MSPNQGDGDILYLVQIPLVSVLALPWPFLVEKLSHVLVAELDPNMHGYFIGVVKTWLGFGDLFLIFKVTMKLNNWALV